MLWALAKVTKICTQLGRHSLLFPHKRQAKSVFFSSVVRCIVKMLVASLCLIWMHAVIFNCSLTRAHPDGLTQPYNLSDEKIWIGRLKNLTYWSNRVFSVGNSSFVATAIRRNTTAQKLVDPNFKLFEDLYGVFNKRRKEKHPNRCNLANLEDNEKWLGKAYVRPLVYQIGELDLSCPAFLMFHDALLSGEITSDFISNVSHTITSSRDALSHAMTKMSLPKDPLWTRAYENTPHRREEGGHLCFQDTSFGYRINGTWYIRVAISNAVRTRAMPNYQRHVINEWVSQSYNKSLEMVHFRYSERDKLEKSTAVVYIIGGIFASGTGATSLQHLNGALYQAKRQIDIQVDQANDALTASNIAILALPMVMNFVPISLLGGVSALGMMIYIVITDVVSCIPFLAQGVQLILVSRPGQHYMTSFFVGNEAFSQLEIYAAHCRAKHWYRTAGIAFVSTANVLIVLGMVLEYLSYKFVKQGRCIFLRSSKQQRASA